MADILKVIGLMSGTSLDGVDAAVIETDGERLAAKGPALSRAYTPDFRARLRAALDLASGVKLGDPVPETIRQAETDLTTEHANIVNALLAENGLSASDVALVGFHGQTVLHRPEQCRSWQIGDGGLLAKLTGISVINDFRSADVAAGGQGAPLVPLYHQALVRLLPASGATAVVNIGGVGNVTYIDGETLLAFDTGPGNAPIDDWAQKHIGKPVDRDGALARTGRVDQVALAKMLSNPFFARRPPKSLDRLEFGIKRVAHLSVEDGAATLACFTAASIARAPEHFPKPVTRWIICGGGRHNPVIMEELRKRLTAPVLTAEDAGWRGDFIEAEAFAYLAVRSFSGLPLSLPTTTGVPTPMTGGHLYKA